MKIIEKVRVLSVDGSHARVEITEHDPASCGSCPTSSSCHSDAGGARKLRVQGLQGAEVGQELTVELDLISPAWAGFLLFMLPMLVAFAVGMAAYLIFGNETVGFVGAVVGVLVAYTCVYFAGRGNLPRATPVGESRTKPG